MIIDIFLYLSNYILGSHKTFQPVWKICEFVLKRYIWLQLSVPSTNTLQAKLFIWEIRK